ncbi:hypothetical protein KDA_49480 [Dictyobacter alpinus]|uniref:Uncharacterized protein n=1 Tax=Dictyobacter alpinus TaxID=2014873 RepID=A0A402BDM4_9CHLR|nr:hypothetical protein [Dictyobacter alpinus]GCE29464.1 hypothetical protein KDA_49480 [Dictyobacter alpinus]
MENMTWMDASSQVEQQDAHERIDLDIRIVEHAQPLSDGLVHQGSGYLTCKTDSTCDGSDAC